MKVTVAWKDPYQFYPSIQMSTYPKPEFYEKTIYPFVETCFKYLKHGFRDLKTDSDMYRFFGFSFEADKLWERMTEGEMIAWFHKHCRLTSQWNNQTKGIFEPLTKENIASHPW